MADVAEKTPVMMQSMSQARMILLQSRVQRMQNEKEKEEEKNRQKAALESNKMKTKISLADLGTSDNKQFVSKNTIGDMNTAHLTANRGQ